MNRFIEALKRCELCPRKCGVNRLEGEIGFCGAGNRVQVAHWGLHFGEEPPISGTRGSGTIFFSPCNMRCLFCQNHQISHENFGEELSKDELADIFFKLEAAGAHNINLVSPTPYTALIASAIQHAKNKGLRIPFVYNTNAYENVSTIEMLEGLIDIYLPDFKYWHASVARKLSSADDYPAAAMQAIFAMKKQVGDLKTESNIATRGLIIRHLVLPGKLAGTESIVAWIKKELGTQTALSLMAQYQPLHRALERPMLRRTITAREYEQLLKLLIDQGFENVFIQELESEPLFVPDFTHAEPFKQQGHRSRGMGHG
jgi:putative pyruvate formate lyase activating enzyme